MNIFKHTILFASLLFSGLGPSVGGQARLAPTKDFFDSAALVVIVDVEKVTKIEVSTGDYQISNVYVAEAKVLQTLKSDHHPTPKERKIAIIGSTIPRSTAVWQPIESKRYLAFLNPEQGHYRYVYKYAMRPISAEGKVDWIEKNAQGVFELDSIDIEDAIKRIQSLQGGGAKGD